MKRLFIDSSVLFSAAYSSRGNARNIILMAARKELTAVISKLVINETLGIYTCFPKHLLDRVFAPYAVPKASFNSTRSLLRSIRYEKCFRASW